MNYQKIITTIIVLLSFCWYCTAQELSIEDILLEPSDLLKEELSAGANTVFQTTKGDANTTSIIQIQQGDNMENVIRTLQVGNENSINLEQQGTGNQIVVLQNGNSNTYHLIQEGVLNKSLVIQNGNFNEIYQELKNGSNVTTEFIQEGNSNRIEHIIDGINHQSFQLTQKGDGLQVVISQSGN